MVAPECTDVSEGLGLRDTNPSFQTAGPVRLQAFQAVPVRRRQDLPCIASSRRPSSLPLPRSGREASKPNRKWLNTMARNNCYVLVFLALASGALAQQCAPSRLRPSRACVM